MTKKLCIFDLDGTLVDSLEDLAVSMNFALGKHGLPAHPKEAYRLFVGSGVKKLIERAAAPLPCSEALLEALRESFSSYYKDHCFDFTRPYPGCAALLRELSLCGIAVGILSNKPDPFVRQIAEHLFPGFSFSVIWGKREEYPAKPDPTSLLECIRLSGVKRDECFYIGDSDVDILTAKRAGVQSCGAVWGFRGEEELRTAGADFLLKHPLALLSLL